MQHLTIATSSGIVWLMLVSHFGAALVALLAGTIALSVVKGGRLHKRIAGPTGRFTASSTFSEKDIRQ